jgi:hypothetical protein
VIVPPGGVRYTSGAHSTYKMPAAWEQAPRLGWGTPSLHRDRPPGWSQVHFGCSLNNKMPAAWEHLSAKYAQVGLRHSETGRVRWDGEGGWEKEYSWLLLSSLCPH